MKTLNILYLEDSPEDAELVKRELKKLGLDLNFNVIESKIDFENALKNFDMDVILSDHSMYQFDSIEAFEIYKKSGLDVPFILVTGSVSEEFAVQILHKGADDYIIKDNLTRLPSAILNAIEKKEAETKNREAGERILQAYKFAEGAMEAAPDCIFGLNKNANIVMSNLNAGKLFGYSRGEFLTLNPNSLLRDPEGTRNFNDLVEHGDLLDHAEYIATKKNGEMFPSEVNSSIVKTQNGNVTLISVRDISTRKVVERELLQLNDALENNARKLNHINKELEQYAYVVSHELQEPLRMVSSFLTLLRKNLGDRLNPKAESFLQYAVDGSNRMRKIVYDLLDYSKIGHSPESLEIVDLNQVLEDVENLFRKQITDSKAVIEADKLPCVHVHPTLMSLVFQNLISNSLKFQKQNQNPYITITVQELDLEWKIGIKDNGIGIAPEYHDKVFELLQKAHPELKTRGSGIGLSISKKASETMNGQIWIESEIDNGCIVYFTISKSPNSK